MTSLGISSALVDQEIALLDARLLAPVVTVAPDAPSYEDRIAVNAYLVLAHACVEEFIEAAFLALATKLADCQEQGDVSVHVARFSYASSEYIPDSMRASYKSRTLRGVLTVALKQFSAQFVSLNHGIRAENIEKLAKGLGLLWDDFESICGQHLPALDTLGSQRGPSAHLSTFTQSTAPSVTTHVYPDDVRGWVKDAVDAAKAIESYLASLSP